jgi:hypothetical protein
MHQMRISTTQVSIVMLRSKKLETRKKKNVWKLKEPSDENQTECHEIEPNPSDRAMHEGDNPSFWDEFTKFILIHIRIWKQVVLSNWAVETAKSCL